MGDKLIFLYVVLEKESKMKRSLKLHYNSWRNVRETLTTFEQFKWLLLDKAFFSDTFGVQVTNMNKEKQFSISLRMGKGNNKQWYCNMWYKEYEQNSDITMWS